MPQAAQKVPISVALELSGRQGSVAIGQGNQVLVERAFEHGLQHAAAVVPLIDSCLKEHALTPADVNLIAVSGGPGSFTGLRISITLAKTWHLAAVAMGRHITVVRVPTGRVLADNMPAEACLVSTMLDAKRGQVFSATYCREANGPWRELKEARLIRLDELLQEASEAHWNDSYGKHFLIGEGVPYHIKPGMQFPGVVITPPELWRARASAVLAVGLEQADRGEIVVDADALTPVYVRLPEAEEKFLQQTAATRA